MADGDLKHTLTCMRVDDLTNPPVPSRRDHCEVCGAEVWVSLRAPAIPSVWCLVCSMAEIEDGGVEVAIDEETVAEIMDYLKGSQQ